MPLERLQKVLAHAGVASRRACEELIRQGRVTVDEVVVTEMGVRVDPTRARIRVDGELIATQEPRRYLMLHKPAGYLSVMDDPRARSDLGDLVPNEEHLFPVGRLDLNSEGLVLLTNDGELANLLMHPRYEHPKTYLALVSGKPAEHDLRKLRQGIDLEEEHTAPAEVELVDGWPRELQGEWWRKGVVPDAQDAGKPPLVWVRVTLREGKKRQVRRMFSAIGYAVVRLIRVGLGPLRLGRLPPGKSRPLTPAEVHALRQTVGSGRSRPPMRAERPPSRPEARAPQGARARRRPQRPATSDERPRRGTRPAPTQQPQRPRRRRTP
jgi:23S rRNA pseudouridine2605 synthase